MDKKQRHAKTESVAAERPANSQVGQQNQRLAYFSKEPKESHTYPQPWGVVTPKKQSPLDLGTTWSGLMGVMTTPALASETHSESAAAARAAGFMAFCLT
ncbi:208fd1b2-009d-4fed-8f71-564d957e90ad [Thermothielavioides terrestris]|uniref:208fd1b2-009d-4fed-8f71-564d957e90ad n=1 Tax=Thermothielavioides terrestris TaxID=2587410 RepID=A0A3S4B207_9PEZI|nr:208fd1b2-009d-4fed-8f71-564d957e90ad [Thermothielavioides terrestris]